MDGLERLGHCGGAVLVSAKRCRIGCVVVAAGVGSFNGFYIHVPHVGIYHGSGALRILLGAKKIWLCRISKTNQSIFSGAKKVLGVPANCWPAANLIWRVSREKALEGLDCWAMGGDIAVMYKYAPTGRQNGEQNSGAPQPRQIQYCSHECALWGRVESNFATTMSMCHD